jgi:hypothetical protein
MFRNYGAAYVAHLDVSRRNKAAVIPLGVGDCTAPVTKSLESHWV